MNKDELYLVVSQATTAKVYPDFVPKKAPLPAISYAQTITKEPEFKTGSQAERMITGVYQLLVMTAMSVITL